MVEVPPAAPEALPELDAAAADPAGAASALGALVRASLSEDWRRANSGEAVLERLAELIELHLAKLGDEVPEVGGEDDGSRSNEAACAACLKLARNLCAGAPSVQGFWWRRGLVQKVVARVRADLTMQGGSRHVAWREAAPTFVTNVVAGNPELRACVLEALFPHGLAALCSLCWKRPELAFILTQNLIASGDGCSSHVQRLVETEEGHCFLFLLISFLRGRKDEKENELSAKAVEWASSFFHGLWLAGGFAPAYRGIRHLTATRLQSFLGATAGVCGDGDGAESWSRPPLSIGFWRLMEGLCGHEEARCLMWHTIHGLLAGPGGDERGSQTASAALAKCLLSDKGFVDLAMADMSECLSSLAREWCLEWTPLEASAEACAALAVAAEEVDMLAPANTWGEAGQLDVQAAEAADETPEEAEAEESEALGEKGGAPVTRLFHEVLNAAVELAAVPRVDGVAFPARLVGAYLTGNLAFIQALHRLRFGSLDVEAPQRTTDSPGAAEAARACLLVEQIRLCGNLLYEQPAAQDFLRLVGGLQVLLSHCHSDHELPLLREASIFAVRNATHGCEVNQWRARELLSEKRAAASAGERLVEDLGLA